MSAVNDYGLYSDYYEYAYGGGHDVGFSVLREFLTILGERVLKVSVVRNGTTYVWGVRDVGVCAKIYHASECTLTLRVFRYLGIEIRNGRLSDLYVRTTRDPRVVNYAILFGYSCAIPYVNRCV